MSRSRKKTPICGNAGTSDKKDKQLASRAYRRVEKVSVQQGEDPPQVKEVTDEWSFSKDGKNLINKRGDKSPEEIEKEMRK